MDEGNVNMAVWPRNLLVVRYTAESVCQMLLEVDFGWSAETSVPGYGKT